LIDSQRKSKAINSDDDITPRRGLEEMMSENKLKDLELSEN